MMMMMNKTHTHMSGSSSDVLAKKRWKKLSPEEKKDIKEMLKDNQF
jgi:hypothetical protein